MPLTANTVRVLREETAYRRKELRQQIRDLSGQRSVFVKKKAEETGGAEDSLDEKIYSAVREQAGKKGLHYEADTAAD